jgi:hypothetical protein
MGSSPFAAVHIGVFLLVSGISVFTPVRTTSPQFIPVAAFVAAIGAWRRREIYCDGALNRLLDLRPRAA